MLITLSTIKQHLNLDENFKEDDNLLLLYLQASEAAVSKHLDMPLDTLVDPKTGYLPKSVEACILLMIGNLYANREAVTYSSAIEVPLSYSYLISLNKHYWIP